jgi:lipoprotein signal peptidase
MIARIGVRVALLIAVVATIGCDRVTKHIATVALAGAPVRSYLADTIRLEYTENTGGF